MLVLSASVGGGHLRAAEAVDLALGSVVPAVIVKNLDVLAMPNAAFRRVFGEVYLDLGSLLHAMGGRGSTYLLAAKGEASRGLRGRKLRFPAIVGRFTSNSRS